MRSISRPTLSFPHLEDATKALIDGYPGYETYDPSFDDKKWRRPSILGTLHAMHGNTCAYCQGQLTPSDRGDVEHFRPKSIYWWLAYVFDNYLLSCARCNRVRKGKRFPLEPGEPRLSYGDGRNPFDEKQLLIDPTVDSVDSIRLKLVHSTWMLVPERREGVQDHRANETIRFFELNLGRIPGERQRAIATAVETAKSIRVGQGDRLALHRMASRFQPYGIFIRRVLQRGYSDLLPGSRDEVRMLIADLRLDLDAYDAALQGSPGHRDTESLRQAALWALGVLWFEPPVGVTAGDISSWIGNKRRPEAQSILAMLQAATTDGSR